MTKQVEVVITAKQQVNHDSYIYSFEFTGEKIHFSIGKYFTIIKTLPTHEHPEGEELRRKYTPINPCSQTNKIDFLVKIYRPNANPNFPLGGKYTPFLETQGVGDKLIIDGPHGKFAYQPGGKVILHDQIHEAKRIFFIAGGSGITPIFQTMAEIAGMKDEKIQMVLLYGNRSEEDIVLRKEIEALGNRVRVHYILDNPPPAWPHYKGYVTHEILKEVCPLDDPATVYIHVGPAPMNKFLRGLFHERYPHSVIFKY